MARQVKRSRSQTLSLRINPQVRFGLECYANSSKTSMTQVIERSLIKLMNATEYDWPEYLEPISDVPKATLTYIVQFTWHEDEVIKLLRLGLIAPNLLSEGDRFIFDVFTGWTRLAVNNEAISFLGTDDVFEGVVGLSADYYLSAHRFNLEKCREHYPRMKAEMPMFFDENV